MVRILYKMKIINENSKFILYKAKIDLNNQNAKDHAATVMNKTTWRKQSTQSQMKYLKK